MLPPPLAPIGQRQVHLDFHTSEYLENIADAFSKEGFQAALKIGHIDSINLFAKCHHSWSYYPTRCRAHASESKFRFTRSAIRGLCRNRELRLRFITLLAWSANDAQDHPEWCVRDREVTLLLMETCLKTSLRAIHSQGSIGNSYALIRATTIIS
jgi:hypothetical protein